MEDFWFYLSDEIMGFRDFILKFYRKKGDFWGLCLVRISFGRMR